MRLPGRRDGLDFAGAAALDMAMVVDGDFDATGYCQLSGLVPTAICDALVKQLWSDLRESNVQACPPNRRLIRKHSLDVHGRDYPPIAFFHCGLTPALADIAGADLLPSASFFRMYVGGDVCRVHSDRATSEYSLSLTLSYSDGIPWPLSIAAEPVAVPFLDDYGEDFAGEPNVSFAMAPGDAVFYQGSARRHGRIAPNPNNWSAHLFLTWVTRDGPYSGEAFESLAMIAK